METTYEKMWHEFKDHLLNHSKTSWGKSQLLSEMLQFELTKLREARE